MRFPVSNIYVLPHLSHLIPPPRSLSLFPYPTLSPAMCYHIMVSTRPSLPGHLVGPTPPTVLLHPFTLPFFFSRFSTATAPYLHW